jgi:SAM-dependent methyltransferase
MSPLAIFFRNLGQLFQLDQRQLKASHTEKFDEAGTRLDRAETRLDHAEPRLDKAEVRADALEEGLAALRQFIEARFEQLEQQMAQQLAEYQTALEEKLEAQSSHLTTRMDATDDKLATTAEELATRWEQRAAAHEAALDDRLQQHEITVQDKLQENAATAESSLTAKAAAFFEELRQRTGAFEKALDERQGNYEAAVDTRFQEYQSALDTRIEDRLRQVELRSDERTAELSEVINHTLATQSAAQDDRFEQRSRAVDLRVDDRLARVEHNLDQRVTSFEKGIDQRLYTREKYVDDRLEMSRDDIVARTDLLLHRFDQRMDKFRRAMRVTLTAKSAGNGDAASETLQAFDQLTSAPALSADAAQATNVQLEAALGSAQTLGTQLVAWKSVAAESLLQFTPDEQEIVDYIFSFVAVDDADEVDYVQQHLRRYLATLQRLPPARTSAARVLELGSNGLHFTPALKKFAGYNQVFCANWSEIDAGLTEQRTKKQRKGFGTDAMSFEVKNFNAERDRFPYPDNHFSLVLCCEMLEHLAHDPMHMLWECNRVLEPDGWLLISTPNLSCTRALEGILCGCQPYLFSQYNLQNSSEHHHREYTPDDVRDVMTAAGFAIATLETEDVWLKSNPAILDLIRQLKFSDELRGDDIFALARKVSAPRERYPTFLYVGVPPGAEEANV